MTRRSGVGSTIAALVAAMALVPTSPAGADGPGCDPERRAVAHRADGALHLPQPSDPPIPCATVVGPAVESADVGVTRSGAVFFAPLNENTAQPPLNVLEGPELVVRSTDEGATWTMLDSGGPTTGGFVPPWMSVDPETSRVWFATTLPSLCGARISWSDDDGETWRTNPTVGCPAQGANKLLEGPPPASGEKPVGYPHVVYYCANGEDGRPSLLYCYRSLDGGTSFNFIGSMPDPELPPGCEEHHPARAGVVGPDGVLYFPTQVCGELGIAISRDEGATWTQGRVATTEIQDLYIASIAVDAVGNLYIAWMGEGSLPHLTISRDRGRTWSEVTKVVAPGVTEVRRVAIAARERGEIALAYLGRSDGSQFDGYITATANALASRKMFWSATVNHPTEPLVSSSDEQSFGDRFFYGTAVIAPNGDVWAGFHCAKTDACPGQRLGVMGRLTALAGRGRSDRLVPRLGPSDQAPRVVAVRAPRRGLLPRR